MHPNKDGMGGQGVGSRTGEVQDSKGESGAGKGHSHREAASAFGGKHQPLTPPLVRGPSSAGALPYLPGQYQGGSSTEEMASVVSPGCFNLPTINLSHKSPPTVTMHTGLKMGVKVFPVSLTGGCHWSCGSLSLSWIFFPS